jgi:hypothetical protein
MVYNSKVMKERVKTMREYGEDERGREKMRESEKRERKLGFVVFVNRSSLFYIGVNRTGSFEPVWFTPGPWCAPSDLGFGPLD